MTVPLPILTERLLIRQFDAEMDVEAAVSVYGDAEVMRYVTGGPLSDEEAVRGALEKYVRAQQEYGFSSAAKPPRTARPSRRTWQRPRRRAEFERATSGLCDVRC